MTTSAPPSLTRRTALATASSSDTWYDPNLRRSYAKRRSELRAALGSALAARAGTLGAPQIAIDPERVATAIMALSIGLAQQALVDPRAVPADLLGETIVLIYRGLLASTED